MPNSNINYLAVIGDLVGSRQLNSQERSTVQKRFQEILDRINHEFKEDIAALFLITAGDETQGILHRTQRCYQILRKIQMDLSPIKIVFGLGYGPLTTELKEYAIGADGPAFYYARQALNEAKKERKAYGKSILREVRIHSNDEIRDQTIDALFLSLAVIRDHLTEQQEKIVELLEKGKSPKEISEILKIPLPNVSRTIETTHYREYELIVACIETWFAKAFN